MILKLFPQNISWDHRYIQDYINEVRGDGNGRGGSNEIDKVNKIIEMIKITKLSKMMAVLSITITASRQGCSHVISKNEA